jgi:hypothetical protein
VVWSFIYFASGRMVALIMLRFWRRESKEMEILVLRHELDILRRQHPLSPAGAQGPSMVISARSGTAA